jgi:phosphatidylglycerol lysyltransferase
MPDGAPHFLKGREMVDIPKARALALKHGWNATAYQIVNPGIDHWFSYAGDCVVGYVRYAGVRVVAGAPVCSRERLADVVDEFERDSRKRGDDVCYFGAEARLEEVLRDSPRHAMALMGAQPAWAPKSWDEIIASRSSLRAQLHRARNKGIIVREFSADEANATTALRMILDEWLSTRNLPPLHFLVEPDTLERLDDRRIFVAHARGPIDEVTPVAFAVLSPVPARDGWLVEQFPRLPSAPNGTVELLLTEAARTVANENARYFTLGLAPLAHRDKIPHPPEPRWLEQALALAGAHGRRFYNFAGLEAFKTKFDPEVWEPVYAIQASPGFTVRALYGIAGAFAARSPLALVAGSAAKLLARSWGT